MRLCTLFSVPAIILACIFNIVSRTPEDLTGHLAASPAYSSSNHVRLKADRLLPIARMTNMIGGSRLDSFAQTGFIERYFGSTSEVLTNARVPEATKILDFMIGRAVSAKFVSGHVEVMSGKVTNSGTFNLVFTTSADPSISNFVSQCIPGSSGFYMPVEKTMVILVDHRLSPTWTALSLLHQGSYAQRYSVWTTEKLRTTDENADAQLEAYTLDRRILAATGGIVWSNAVVFEKRRILHQLHLMGKEIGDEYPAPPDSYPDKLTEAFGKPMSLEEIADRRYSLNCVAMAELIEEHYRKNEVLKRFYNRNYIEALQRYHYSEHLKGTEDSLSSSSPSWSTTSTNTSHL